MSTVFPINVDIFANPVTIKVDGVDLVRAAHVNDLQDAMQAVQDLLITPGVTYVWNANFIADNTPIVTAIKNLDTQLNISSTGLAEHIAYVLITDPIQHHANVIQITPGGNLSSLRLQTALEEHQSDIDNIMVGGSVNGVTLDNRYVKKTGSQTMAGPLIISGNLTVNGDQTLGTNSSNTLTINSTVQVNAPITTTSTITSGDNVLLLNNKFIGLDQYAALLFNGTDVFLKSKGNIILRLDSDDLVDATNDNSTFTIVNGSDSTVVSINELGDISANSLDATIEVSSNTLVAQSELLVGTSSFTDGLIVLPSVSFHLDLDNDSNETGEVFVITKNNDPGTNLASANLLLHVSENSTLTSGIHKLKSGIQETGYFGGQFFSPDPGNIFSGFGVNFKSVMTNIPSSVTLTVNTNINAQSIAVTHINQYGFYVEYASTVGGNTKISGTYATIGN